MHKYSEYKDSGVEWIGEIPNHWDQIRIKYVSDFRLSSVDRHVNKEEIVVSICHYPNVYYNERIYRSTGLPSGTCTEKQFKQFSVKDKDILITKDSESSNDIGVPCLIAEDLENTVCGYHLGHFRFFGDIDSNFIFRFIQSDNARSYFEHSSNGITRYALGKDSITSLVLPVPPIQEQHQISQFLDKKTSKIDSLIEKIERKIKLLKEQRTALINQCVTKGLDPNAEMKDSGVEWIGEIPNHWDTKRLASFGSFYKGKSITKGDLRVTGQPCILYSQIYTSYDRIAAEVHSYIEQRLFDHSIKVTKDIFLFTCSGETADEIGKCVLYYGDEEISIGGDIVTYKLQPDSQFDPVFLSFVFNCKYSQFFKASNSRGEIVVHIYKNQLRELRVVFPDIEEQIEISQYLNKKTSQINFLSVKLQRKIELLKEYRQSLISNIVTGKVKVTEDAS